jgi:CheY-like chemotaxis protein
VSVETRLFHVVGGARPAPEPQAAEPKLGRLHVLIADDNQTNRLVAETLCSMFGCTSRSVEDGAQAVEAARTGVFDLILMDIKMPVMDGLGAIAHIRGHWRTQPEIDTIAEAAGVKVDPTIDGISFLSSLQQSGVNASGLSDREFYFVRREGGINYGGKTIEALIQGDWKIIQDNPFGPLELYNLKIDPKETKNVANEEKQIFQVMAAKLRLHIQNGGKVKWQE